MSLVSFAAISHVLQWLWNTLFHQCLAVIAVYAIWSSIQHYQNPFSWHVILCTLGIIPLSAEALILFSNTNVWSQEIVRKHKYWIHGVLMFIGTFLIITGIAIEIDRKENLILASHFTSAHAITGLICMIFLVFALVCGPLAFSSSLNRFAAPVWFKLAHNIVGQLAYIMSIVCLCLGYYTDFFVFYNSESSRITATVVTSSVAVWSLFYSCKSLIYLIKNIGWYKNVESMVKQAFRCTQRWRMVDILGVHKQKRRRRYD